MVNKKKRMRCDRHYATGRSWDKYEFAYTSKYDGIDYYRCIICWDILTTQVERAEKRKAIREYEYANKWREFYREQREREAELKRRKRDELWDCFIKNELCKGMKLKGAAKFDFKESLPKELLQLTRAMIMLQRKVKDMRKPVEEVVIPTPEEKPVQKWVECRKHGRVKGNDMIKAGKNKSGSIRFKCRMCMADSHRSYYERHKDHVVTKCAAYRESNREKVKEFKRKYWENRHERSKNKIDGGLEETSSAGI